MSPVNLLSACIDSDPRIRIFLIFNLFFTLSNCNQICWIYWNSAVLCFKQLFHIRVWTFARFVWLLNYTYDVFYCLPPQKKKTGKKCTVPSLKRSGYYFFLGWPDLQTLLTNWSKPIRFMHAWWRISHKQRLVARAMTHKIAWKRDINKQCHKLAPRNSIDSEDWMLFHR